MSGVVNRRQVLTGAAGAAVLAAGRTPAPAAAADPAAATAPDPAAGAAPGGPVGAVTARPVAATATCGPPPDFPAVELSTMDYRNWVGALHVEDVPVCRPANPQEVVTVANWAVDHGWTLRPMGYAHGWSPLTLTTGQSCQPPVLLVDLTAHLTAVGTVTASDGGPTVRVQTGASMDTLLATIETQGYGLTATPAPGDLSVGGVLAIDAHGTAVPASGEVPGPGDRYGTLSNRVVSLTAVVWDQATGRFTLRTMDRSDPDCATLLTHLGRCLLTEVTLSVGTDGYLRCLSSVDIPAADLFAAAGPRTMASFVQRTGRVEVIWFPFTDRPWLKVWSRRPTRPTTARPVTTPYNYPFSDRVPRPVAELAGALERGQWYLAPAFGAAQYAAVAAGLTATASVDLWGRSKNVLLYVRPTTLRMHANGYAVPVPRGDVQRVVSAFTAFHSERLAAYAATGRYPVNGPVEIRVTGLDQPVAGSPPPALSAARADGRPADDVLVWLDLLTLPGTPDAWEYFREVERFVFATFPGARPEWSKGWAYTADGPWTDREVITGTVPASFRAGPGPGWDEALECMDRCDPHRVFSNPFLDVLLPPPGEGV